MKLVFLGTSHGFVEVGCFCTATLLETGGAYYLIDCGAPVEALMKNMGKSLDHVRGIFVTHMHEDHVASLSSVLKDFGRRSSTARATFFFPEKAGLEGFLTWVRAMHRRTESDRIGFGLSSTDVFYEDENIRVSGIRTDHIKGYPTYAYRFELLKEDKRILFTGDVCGDMHDFPKEASDEAWDVVVSELTHFHIEDHVDLFKSVNTKQMFFTHKHRQNLEVMDRVIPQLPYPVYIACDGDEICPEKLDWRKEYDREK